MSSFKIKDATIGCRWVSRYFVFRKTHKSLSSFIKHLNFFWGGGSLFHLEKKKSQLLHLVRRFMNFWKRKIFSNATLFAETLRAPGILGTGENEETKIVVCWICVKWCEGWLPPPPTRQKKIKWRSVAMISFTKEKNPFVSPPPPRTDKCFKKNVVPFFF